MMKHHIVRVFKAGHFRQKAGRVISALPRCMPWTDCPGWLQINFQATMVLVCDGLWSDIFDLFGPCWFWCHCLVSAKQKIYGMAVSENWGFPQKNGQPWGRFMLIHRRIFRGNPFSGPISPLFHLANLEPTHPSKSGDLPRLSCHLQVHWLPAVPLERNLDDLCSSPGGIPSTDPRASALRHGAC